MLIDISFITVYYGDGPVAVVFNGLLTHSFQEKLISQQEGQQKTLQNQKSICNPQIQIHQIISKKKKFPVKV